MFKAAFPDIPETLCELQNIIKEALGVVACYYFIQYYHGEGDGEEEEAALEMLCELHSAERASCRSVYDILSL